MRIMVFFDLPTETSEDKREYTKFRKFLVKYGFIMDQESVYSKLALNGTACNAVIENVRKNAPKKGDVRVLTVTEKQFGSMEIIVGTRQKEIIDSDERFIVI